MAPREKPVLRESAPIGALGVIAPPPIMVQSPKFDGSLAMLFKCVRDHKVDLADVPLGPVCEAYFLYLMQAEVKDLDEAAAALIALSYLLERKAWCLLPTSEPEPEPEEALELAPPTVKLYEPAIEALMLYQEERSQTFFRTVESGPDPYEVPYTLKDITPNDLARAFERVLSRAKPDEVQPLGPRRRSITEVMGTVLKALTKDWRSLDALVPEDVTRSEAVYWFLSILELVRLGQAGIRLNESEVEFARASR